MKWVFVSMCVKKEAGNFTILILLQGCFFLNNSEKLKRCEHFLCVLGIFPRAKAETYKSSWIAKGRSERAHLDREEWSLVTLKSLSIFDLSSTLKKQLEKVNLLPFNHVHHSFRFSLMLVTEKLLAVLTSRRRKALHKKEKTTSFVKAS